MPDEPRPHKRPPRQSVAPKENVEQIPQNDDGNADENRGWIRWSEFVLGAIRGIRGELDEIYIDIQRIDGDRHVDIVSTNTAIQQVREEVRKELNNMNTELVKIQMKLAGWATMFGVLFTIITTIVTVYKAFFST